VSSLRDIVRRATSDIQSESIEQPLSGTTYDIKLDDTFIAWADDAARDQSSHYYANAMLQGNVDKLLATATVQYLSSDGREPGNDTFDFICLLKVALGSESGTATANSRSAATKASYFAVNKLVYTALRQQLAGTSLKDDDSLVLRALSAVTTMVGDAPAFLDNVAVDFARWLDLQVRGTDAHAILDIIRKYSATLYDFPLAIPEIKAVEIAGKVTITAPAGVTVSPRDFLGFEIPKQRIHRSSRPATHSF
jgi:hypothetical protein